jgi:AcrR family transcriptional regulator
VLAAAERVLAADGLGAPMPAIADAAGVGVGSVYRHFGSKEGLIDAVVVGRLAWYAEQAEAAAAAPDPWEALVELIRSAGERQSVDALLVEALEVVGDRPEVAAGVERSTAAVQRLFDRTREQGALREDVDANDLRLILIAVGALASSPRLPAGGWRRLLAICIDGLRSGAVHPLPPAVE